VLRGLLEPVADGVLELLVPDHETGSWRTVWHWLGPIKKIPGLGSISGIFWVFIYSIITLLLRHSGPPKNTVFKSKTILERRRSVGRLGYM
jgi:hypothetical protein